MNGKSLPPPPEDERAPGEMAEVKGTRLALRVTGAPAGAGVFVSLSDISEANNVCFEIRERMRHVFREQDQRNCLSPYSHHLTKALKNACVIALFHPPVKSSFCCYFLVLQGD